MHNRAANTYKRIDLESAPKPQVLSRLFERFAADVAAAKQAITAGDIQARARAIDHALRIVAELQASLDHAAAPELCENLAALYDYVAARLTAGNVEQSAAPLDRAAQVMARLADAFRGAP